MNLITTYPLSNASHSSKKLTQLLLAFVLLVLFAFPSTSDAEEWTYTTRPNDNLWDISKKYLKSVNYWKKLQNHNSVDIAKHLAPGTRLRIPLEWLKIQAAPALVVNVTGKVEYFDSTDKKLKPLASRQTVSIGDKVITDADGSALIQFADGSTLLVQKNSQVIFNTLSSYGETGMVDTRLRLQQGRVETSVTPMRDASSRYEITTPAAVAAVRGTQFRIAYENQKESMASEVVKGAINLAAAGVDQPVKKGFGSITEKGKPPQTPVKLLEKPEFSEPAKKVRYLPYPFSWLPLNGAEQYRFQISSSKHKDTPIFENTTDSSKITLNTLKDGQYILRVRGIDKNGLEGFNAEHSFEINTDFPVVTLISPVKNIHISDDPFTFKWNAEQNASQYHLQVSTDIEFKNIIFDRLETKPSFSQKDKLTPGQYYWRIAAMDDQGNKGEYSVIEHFAVTDNRYEVLWLLLYSLPAFLL